MKSFFQSWTSIKDARTYWDVNSLSRFVLEEWETQWRYIGVSPWALFPTNGRMKQNKKSNRCEDDTKQKTALMFFINRDRTNHFI